MVLKIPAIKKLSTVLLMIAMLIVSTACSSSTVSESGSSNSGSSGSADSNSEPSESGSEGVQEIEMVTFSPPSLGAFLTPIIEEKQFDIENGIDVKFVERPPSAYNSEFASGQYKVGGSAALLSEALRMDRGVKVTYLFNLFDFWGTVITADESITTLKDLEGKDMAAAKSTTNFAMFQYFAQKSDADVSTMNVLNAETSALVTYAEADRADAVQLWEPAYSILMDKSPEKYHQVDFGLEKWEEYTGATSIPYLGIAAHQDWAEENKELIPKLYQSFSDAASWVQANSKEASEIIAATIPGGEAEIIQKLIENNDLLGLNVQPAIDLKDDIKAVFKAGLEINYLEKMPDDSVIYSEKLK
ncbi:ABC transporter substrate-binding protein [Bacillus sp. Marseille-P3661]|uniref:ABC transporter substrate-binding protein n=1 Tax=Bacillus sp. Marseille-P3661 TaxID=1936234 RepID=UPI0015E19EB8|nr:ABC transporter substrate-binding protein [Bacillus sp. Marseille-P3661]